MLIFTLVLYAYSLVMIYVFYVLPSRQGLAFGIDLADNKHELNLDSRDSLKLGASMMRQEQTAKELFSVLQQDDEFTKSNAGTVNRKASATSSSGDPERKLSN